MDVCTHIVSDRLYLIDNLLCLLSNAVKYSERGATIDVIIEIITVEATPTSPKGRKGSRRLSELGSFRGVLEASSSPKGRKGSNHSSRPGNLNGSIEIFSKAKECSKEIQALFGISGIPNPNLDRLKKEMSARFRLEEPLAEMVRPAMLVVRVVDSGIGLSGITEPCCCCITIRCILSLITRQSSSLIRLS